MISLCQGNILKENAALMITGSIASMKAPTIARTPRRYGADIQVYTSEEKLIYTTLQALEWSTMNPVVTRLTSAAEQFEP